jgi:hypothetical protein
MGQIVAASLSDKAPGKYGSIHLLLTDASRSRDHRRDIGANAQRALVERQALDQGKVRNPG